MRIAILSHNYPQTSNDRKDAGIFLYDFANELSKKAEVFIFCPNFDGEKEKYKKVPVTWFKWGGGSEKFGNWSIKNPKSILHFFNLMSEGKNAAVKFAKRNKIDFCVAAWALPSGIYAQEIKKQLGTPYATWSLGSDINQYSNLPVLGTMIKQILKKADVCFANSWLLCQKVERIADRECKFLPAVTNLRTIKTKKHKSPFFKFLFVGRLEKVKGPDVLLNAIAKLSSSKKKFHVDILGDGTLLPTLREHIKDNNLEKVVALRGRASETEVAQYMANADCLVIPSRNESLPLVLLEAAKSALPAVATDVGDCKRLISKYKIGYVAEAENPESLTRAMKKALLQGKTFKKALLRNLKKVESDYNLNAAVDILLEATNTFATPQKRS